MLSVRIFYKGRVLARIVQRKAAFIVLPLASLLCLLTATADNQVCAAGFYGQTVQLEYFFPDLDTLNNYPPSPPLAREVGPGVEFTDLDSFRIIPVSIDFSATKIELDFSTIDFSGGTFVDSEFNGFVFTDILGTIPAIGNVTIDTSVTTLALTDSNITSTENQIFVNMSDLHFDTTTFARLDVQFVPLPSALLLLTSGLIGIAGLLKRRST